MAYRKLNKYIDHTLLSSAATTRQIENLCDEALKYDFYSVCINPTNVLTASKILYGSNSKVCTVIGFPLGANITEVKILEAQRAIENGAQEIDIVMNIGKFLSEEYSFVEDEVSSIINKIKSKEILTKIILECCLIKDKKRACEIVIKSGANFVKTSTGFSNHGATTEDVSLLREYVGSSIGIKASGGIRNYTTAISMIECGANRLGTSHGVKIIEYQKLFE